MEERSVCNFYMAFGHCAASDGRHGCRFKHEGPYAEQTYFYAKINDIDGNNFFLDRRKLRYYVEKAPWYTAGAEKGNFVIFQESAKIYDGKDRKFAGVNRGRVVAKIGLPIGSSTPGWMNNLREQIFPIKVYTIDPEGTRYHDDAYSVDDVACEKSDCNIIGVHISASALNDVDQIDGSRIPGYPTEYFRNPAFSLDRGKVVAVVSIYFHTECKTECKMVQTECKTVWIGPVLNIARVMENYSYSDLGKFKENFDALSKHFSNATFFEKSKHTYITRYPRSWRQRYVLQEMMIAYKSHAQLQQTGQIQQHFIVQERSSNVIYKEEQLVPEDTKEVVISKEVYDRFFEEKTKTKPDEDAVLAFVAAGLKSAQPRNPKKSVYVPKHKYDIQMSPISDKNIIPCTSPVRKLHDYVNQQILLNGMLGNQPLYSDEDLRGILVTRFNTPRLSTVIVTEMHESHFELDYLNVQGISPTICKIPYTTFQEDSAMQNEKVEIRLSNASWKTGDFCNQNLVRLSASSLHVFLNDLRKKNSGPYKEATADAIVVEKSPYQDDGDSILLVLQTGAELLFQISNEDAQDKNGFGVRLLKIGKGCHFCITHFYSPDMVFMSERADIRKLIPPETIIGLKHATVEQKVALSDIFHNITIKWPKPKDREEGRCYYSHGLFRSDQGLVKGDLLCIRKEMSNDSGEYVWCCHGVVSDVEKIVSDVEDQEVTFKVCTLMQSDHYPGQENFCVEIVKYQVESQHSVESPGLRDTFDEMTLSVPQNDSQ